MSGRKDAPSSLFFSVCFGKVVLHCQPFRDIIDTKNKNAAAYGCYQHPQACTGENPTYTTAPRPYPHGILYDISLLLARVPLPYLFVLSFLLGGICFSHCVGLLCAVFLFCPGTQGAETPPDLPSRFAKITHTIMQIALLNVDLQKCMEGCTMNELMGFAGKALAILKAKRDLIRTVIFIALVVVAVIAVQRAWNYGSLKKENEELTKKVSSMESSLANLDEIQKKLTYSEGQVELYKKSTNALTQQVAGLNAIKEDLNNKVEELLHIQESVPTITRNELETQISSLSELVTKKYMYRNATQKDSDKSWIWGWTIPFSDVSLLATYEGTITTSIDLKEVKVSVNNSTKTVTITMPGSKIFDHNIPQETINVLQVKNNLFNSISFNDYNKYFVRTRKTL